MQPFLFISCPVEGIIYLNGRLIAAVKGESVSSALSPTGAVYLEFKPVVPGYLPLARSLCLSRGSVVEGSLSDERGLSVVSWPGGIAEAALEPEPREGYKDEAFEADIRLSDGTRQRLIPLNDVAGHAIVETYRLERGDWTLAESEVMWDDSCPRRPQTPAETALAAAQAAILGQHGEAAGYAAPNRPHVERALRALYGEYDGCAEAVYCPTGDRVALVKVIRSNFARVDYALFSCAKLGGGQGEWKLESFEVARGDARGFAP